MRLVCILALAATLAGGFAPQTAGAATNAIIYEGSFALPDPFVDVVPSTRSAGMGGASAAVFWGDSPDVWANPALLGLASGLHYESGRSSSPSSSPHGGLECTSRQTTLGYGGLGLSFAGQPGNALGELNMTARERIVYVTSFGETPVLSTVDERQRSWGVGASLSELLSTAARLRHHAAPGFTRHVDLAFGYAEKAVRADQRFIDASVYTQRGSSRDMGLLARVGGTLGHGGPDAMPLRLDAAYGLSVQNSGDRVVSGPERTYVVARHLRNGLAARATLGARDAWRQEVPSWLAPALDSFLSLGFAYDAERASPGSASRSDYGLHHYGMELGVTSVFSLQLGRFESVAHYAATTWGYSVAVPMGRAAGVRYAHASVPSAPYLEVGPTPHDSWSAWLDPVALYRAVR